MSNHDIAVLVLVAVGALVIVGALLLGVLVVWPLGLILVLAGYFVGGAPGVIVGLIVAGIVGLILNALSG